jgi:hypothetical protein
MESRRWVIERKEGCAKGQPKGFSRERRAVRDRDLGFRGEGSQRVAAERCDNDRLEQRELPLQEARAGGDLSGLRITIIGRTTLDHVEDEDIGALKSDQVEE